MESKGAQKRRFDLTSWEGRAKEEKGRRSSDWEKGASLEVRGGLFSEKESTIRFT